MTDQNKQLNNCTCGNPPRGAHWEGCASLCTKSNYEGEEKKGCVWHNQIYKENCENCENVYTPDQRASFSLLPQDNKLEAIKMLNNNLPAQEYVSPTYSDCAFKDTTMNVQENDWKEKVDDLIRLARASRDQEWRRAINDRIKHQFNGYGGTLGFIEGDLLDLMSLSPEEEK